MLDTASLKASIVLQAMVTGLLKSKDNPDFILRMTTYGFVKNNLCYGCCATVALAEMFGEGKLASEMMIGFADVLSSNITEAHLSDVLQLDPSSVQGSLPIDLKYLERGVDSARLGYVSSLIGFFRGEVNESFDYRWELNSDNWEEQIPDVERTIAEMAAAGY